MIVWAFKAKATVPSKLYIVHLDMEVADLNRKLGFCLELIKTVESIDGEKSRKHSQKIRVNWNIWGNSSRVISTSIVGEFKGIIL